MGCPDYLILQGLRGVSNETVSVLLYQQSRAIGAYERTSFRRHKEPFILKEECQSHFSFKTEGGK